MSAYSRNTVKLNLRQKKKRIVRKGKEKKGKFSSLERHSWIIFRETLPCASTLHISIHFLLTTTSWSWYCFTYFNSEENRASEKLRNLLVVTQLGHGECRIWAGVAYLQSLCHELLCYKLCGYCGSLGSPSILKSGGMGPEKKLGTVFLSVSRHPLLTWLERGHPQPQLQLSLFAPSQFTGILNNCSTLVPLESGRPWPSLLWHKGHINAVCQGCGKLTLWMREGSVGRELSGIHVQGD